MHNANVLSSAHLSSIWKIRQLHADMKGQTKIRTVKKQKKSIKCLVATHMILKKKSILPVLNCMDISC
jgi:hypothetical protein